MVFPLTAEQVRRAMRVTSLSEAYQERRQSGTKITFILPSLLCVGAKKMARLSKRETGRLILNHTTTKYNQRMKKTQSKGESLEIKWAF